MGARRSYHRTYHRTYHRARRTCCPLHSVCTIPITRYVRSLSARASHLPPSPFGVYYTYHQVRPLPISARLALAALSIRCVSYHQVRALPRPGQQPLRAHAIAQGHRACLRWQRQAQAAARAPAGRRLRPRLRLRLGRAAGAGVGTGAGAGAGAGGAKRVVALVARTPGSHGGLLSRQTNAPCNALCNALCNTPCNALCDALRWPSITSNQCTM